MKTKNPHWSFHLEVLARALSDLESTCTAKPGSPEFLFLRSEAPVILSEAREALAAIKSQARALEDAFPKSPERKTQH